MDAEPVRESLNSPPTLTISHQLGDVVLAESALALHTHDSLPARLRSGEQRRQDQANRHE